MIFSKNFNFIQVNLFNIIDNVLLDVLKMVVYCSFNIFDSSLKNSLVDYNFIWVNAVEIA